MNWTASLLRNQLTKERAEFNARLNLLTSTSIDAQNYLALESEKSQYEQDIKQLQQDLTDLQKDYQVLENKEQLISYQRHNLEQDYQTLKTLTTKKISQKDKELRDYQAYHQRELKRVVQQKEQEFKDLPKQLEAFKILANHRLQLLEQEKQALINLAKKKLANKKEFKEFLATEQAKWASERNDLQQLIKTTQAEKDQALTKQKKLIGEATVLRNKVDKLKENITTLESQIKETENSNQQLQTNLTNANNELLKVKETLQTQINSQKQELDFTNSKTKQLKPLFNNLVEAIKASKILTGKKEIKEAASQIEQLMEWEQSPLEETNPNTPLGE